MWKTVKLGKICNFEGGSQPPKKEFVYEPADGYVRFLQIRDFKSDKNITYIPIGKKNRLCVESDILIGRYGASVGQILSGLSGAYNVALMKTIPKEELISKGWLQAYLTSPLFQKPLMEVSSRSAQNGFSKDDIYDFDVPLPTLAEQQLIVAKLDAAFAEIDEAVEVTKNSLLSLKQFNEKFISDTFNTTGTNWLTGSISDFCSIKSGSTVDEKFEVEAGDIAYLKVADMNISENQNSIVTSSRFLKASDVRQTQIIEAGSIIFPKRGGAILTNKKRITDVPICADLNIMSVKSNGSIQPKLLFYYFQNVDMRQLGSGSSIPQINNYDIEPLKISFPKDTAEQSAIVIKLDDVSQTITGLSKIYDSKVVALSSLKSAILAQELQSEVA